MLRGAVGRVDADDCFQETFLAALRAYPRLERRRQPARLADDDRPPQGGRPPSRPGTAAAAGRGGRRGRRRATPRLRLRTQASGRGSERCRRSSGRRSPCASPATFATRRSQRRSAARPRPPAAACTRESSDSERSLHEGRTAEGDGRRAGRRGGTPRRRLRARRLALRAAPAGRTPRGLVRSACRTRTATSCSPSSPRRSRRGCWRRRRRLDQARRELDLYFEGRLRDFDLPLDWQLSRDFRRRVLRAIARIPYGKTRTYTEVAASAGNARAVRAAGSACGSNPIPIVVPCHRVLRTGGGLGGYGGGLPMKEALLELEGALRPD